MTDLSHARRRPFVGLFLFALVLSLGSAAALAYERPTPPSRELSGHTAGVTSVAVFPDGARAVTGSRDRTVKIWDLRGARVERTLEAHKGAVLAVAVSRDGKRVASAGADKVVRVWEVASGDLIAQLEGHTGEVVGVAFLPDGQVLSGARDGLRRWDVEKEETVWRSDPEAGGVFDMTVSADGSRAACFNFHSGTVDVWDLAARKRVGQFGGETGYLVPGLALSPDGREVIGHGGDNGHRLLRWDVGTGKQLPVPDDFAGERLAISVDGRLVAGADLNGRAEVWDTQTWRQVGFFGGGTAAMDMFLSLAFAPDGKSLLATTGFHLPDNAPAHSAKGDKLLIFDLSSLGAAARSGAKAGKLSWDELPVRVKLASGQKVDFDASPLRRKRVSGRGLTEGLDAFFVGQEYEGSSSFFLHRTPGLLEEVPVAPDARLHDVVWDGTYIWAAARNAGLFVYDRGGKLVARIADDQGLPRSTHILKLYPLAPGRILAAGLDGHPNAQAGTGWCGIIEQSDGGKPARVHVFFRESQLPPEWRAGMDQRYPAFRPKWIIEPPAAGDGDAAAGKRVRSVWVACGGLPASDTPILRVDPDAATFNVYNLQPPNKRPVVVAMLPDTPLPYWLGPRELMYHAEYTERNAIGETGIDPGVRKLVVHTAWPNEGNGTTPFLPVGDQVYLPGKRWHRIDPRTLAVEDIGPGLRINGALAEEEAQYFVSGVLGPAAFSVETGRLYRFSVDPSHPLATAATLDPPPPGKPIPPEGAVEFVKDQTVFYCGDGALRFANGKLVLDFRVAFPYRNPWAELDAEVDRTRAILRRLSDRMGAGERVGLSREQVQRMGVTPRRDGPKGIDMKQVQAQYAAWEAAAPGAAKDEAAKPLLAAARAAGEWEGALNRDFMARVREVATPRQWKLMNYQIPTEEDDKASAAMTASKAPDVHPGLGRDRLYLGAAGAVVLGVVVAAGARRAALRRR
jgi:hypothetical protein